MNLSFRKSSTPPAVPSARQGEAPTPSVPEARTPFDVVVAPPRAELAPGWESDYRPSREELDAARSARRSRLAVVVLVALVVLAFAGGVAYLGSQDGDGGSARERRAAQAAAAAFAPPASLAVGGELVQSRVLPSGDLWVTHWFRSRTPMQAIELKVPSVLALSGKAVNVSRVEVAADGRAIPGQSVMVGGRLTFQFAPASAAYVAYRLSGTVERTSSATPRAIARLLSLDVRPDVDVDERTQQVTGAQVLSMACSGSLKEDPTPRPCGAPAGGQWEAVLVGSAIRDRLQAQLELPAEGS